jgi:hypothetical protein
MPHGADLQDEVGATEKEVTQQAEAITTPEERNTTPKRH